MQHNGSVGEAALTRDGNRVLSWSDNTVRLWDAATGQQIGPSMQHDDEVYGAQLSKEEISDFVVVQG